MPFLIAAAFLGLIPAMIAQSKGRSFGVWWIFGAALFIVALPAALLAEPDADRLARKGVARKCPFCAEVVKWEAIVCKHCGKGLEPAGPPPGRVGDRELKNPFVRQELETYRCPQCAEPVAFGTKFCGKCGASQE